MKDESNRKPLAREDSAERGPKVGKYTVLLSEFESIAIPCLQKEMSDAQRNIIIDEIGKKRVQLSGAVSKHVYSDACYDLASFGFTQFYHCI